MRPKDGAAGAWNRLSDALAADLLAADAAEVRDSHPGAAARVQADAIRQALRRRAAEAPHGDGMPRDLVRALTTRLQREGER